MVRILTRLGLLFHKPITDFFHGLLESEGPHLCRVKTDARRLRAIIDAHRMHAIDFLQRFFYPGGTGGATHAFHAEGYFTGFATGSRLVFNVTIPDFLHGFEENPTSHFFLIKGQIQFFQRKINRRGLHPVEFLQGFFNAGGTCCTRHPGNGQDFFCHYYTPLYPTPGGEG